MVVYIVVAIFIIWLAWYIWKNFKVPKLGSLVMVDGGVKCGKSTVSLCFAYKEYKRNKFRWKIEKFFCKLFKKDIPEEPLFYSFTPVGFPYVPLTEDLILRKKRFAYRSVIWIDEASLLADSMLFRDEKLNDKLCLFNKLIGHETRGGTLVYNSQSIGDLHYGIKRSLSQTYYVHSLVCWIPFFVVANIREERYSEDSKVLNTYGEDVEDKLKKVLIPKSTWKKFDSYCFSSATDDLEVDTNVITVDDLKVRRLASFNPRHCGDIKKLIGGVIRREKKDD